MAEADKFQDVSLGAKMTGRYLVALGLIACVIITSYLLLINRLHQNENDAYIINISGMQRMLSQRIALTAGEVHHAKTPEEAQLYSDKMRAALDRMVSNHNILTQKTDVDGVKVPMSDVMHDMYFNDGGLDERVTNYMGLAGEFLEVYSNDGLGAVRERGLVNEIIAIARNGLLLALDDAVSQYQAESEEAIARFQRLETIVVSVALFVLLLEVLFIFRPMVKSIVCYTQDLTEANKELVEFSYRISHDLRAPVISALGLGQMARKMLDDDKIEDAKQSLDYSNASLSKMDKVIEDVIKLTKVKSIDLQTEPVDLKDLVAASFEKIAHMPQFEKIMVRTDIRFDDEVNVKLHPLRQILENLFSNAVKYSDPEQAKPFIEVTATRVGNTCEVCVRDNGLGIDEKYRDKVFGMFQRFHPKVSFGSGLGLYIVLQNVKAIEGEIVYKPLEQGSEFIVTFPS